MRIAVTILVGLALITAAALIVVYTGAYNVSAAAGHWDITRWALVTVTENSIESHASGIEAPNFTAEMRERGAVTYDAMCAICHGAPGMKADEFTKGMLPMPPDLSVERRYTDDAADVYWTVHDGIKFTGMPAFGPTHNQEVLWDVTAFVVALPGMTADQYGDLMAAGREKGGHQHGGGEQGEHRSSEGNEQEEGGAAGSGTGDTHQHGEHEHGQEASDAPSSKE